MSSTYPLTAIPPPPGQVTNLVDPENLSYRVVFCCTIMTAISTIFLCLRLYTRKFIAHNLGWDDLWACCSWANAIGVTICDLLYARYGLGVHLWNVPLDKYVKYFKVQFAFGFVYFSALAFAKLSVCCFYLRLSPERKFRMLVFIAMGFTATYSILGLFILIFACKPIAASWNVFLEPIPTTKCINRPAHYLAQAGLNIFTDVFLFLLPLRTIWGLQLQFRQKMSVSSILTVGLVICVITTIRLQTIQEVLNTDDFTWAVNTSEILSSIEVHLSIVCISMPTLHQLVKHFFPNLLGRATPPHTTFASTPSRRSALKSSNVEDVESLVLHNYRERPEARNHSTSVTAKGYNSKHRDLDTDSQDSAIGGIKEGAENKEHVYVTRTVQIS